jgi:hypothetical protein
MGSDVTRLDAIPQSGIRRAPRVVSARRWWWALPLVALAAGLGLQRHDAVVVAPSTPPRATPAPAPALLALPAPLATASVLPAPPPSPSAVRPARRKAPAAVRRSLPRAEDLFSRH